MSAPTGSGGFRYGPWDGGPDPLASPFDAAGALDEMSTHILDGRTPREALDALLRRGTNQRRGLEDLRRQVERRRREARARGRLDGTLEQVRELLDTAVGQERAALFPDPSDDARLREAELDALPADPARAVNALAGYEWRSPQARETFEKISDLLRREVLDSQFRGMKQALENATPQDIARVTEMLAALNDMLEADARGEHTDAAFERFMRSFGDFFPENPQTLDELVDSLARRAAAAAQLLAGLSPQQRQELADLMASALADLGMAAELSRLQQALRAARPDLGWGRRGRFRDTMTGDTPLGLGDATSVLEELAELDELAAALSQDYPGASLEDVDPDAVARALGRDAVDDLRTLQQIEKELERQGFLTRNAGKLELTPRAVRRIGQSALSRIFQRMDARGRGDHDSRDAGAAGEPTGTSRPWHFGDTQPIDVVRTVRNAVLRAGPGSPDGMVELDVRDFEVTETERRSSAVVCLLVDLSYSMALRGTWGVAKSTALALHTLIDTKFPQDTIHLVGFSDYARLLRPVELAGLDSEVVQGTNLQHALMLAGRLLSRHPDSEPVVLVITDGEPTAHLMRNGTPSFSWPPVPETLELTLAEVDRLTRRGATINVFMLDDEPRLVQFVDEVVRRNGGRMLSPDPGTLGRYVVRDYLRSRGGRRRAAS
ncbi:MULTISPECIES: vWA domain-containing protein [Protofrankia]|uniref:von Willebrand factor type A n=1 Tax=Candidatus Protofrankia datiscae TaxID=2716812 RepID=F8AVU8_9ACTN|nr:MULTISPECIES: VWA domain-containing protein [Protofrankia]AEH08286.1 von Willebrand factor type A [Candidatus Protofrankia datiscae]